MYGIITIIVSLRYRTGKKNMYQRRMSKMRLMILFLAIWEKLCGEQDGEHALVFADDPETSLLISSQVFAFFITDSRCESDTVGILFY
jgi:hypothetical protein